MIPLLLLLPGLASDDWATRAAERERLHNHPWLCLVCGAYGDLEAEHALRVEGCLLDEHIETFRQKFWTYFTFAATWHSRQEFVMLGPSQFVDSDHANKVWLWLSKTLWPERAGWGHSYLYHFNGSEWWWEQVWHPVDWSSWENEFMGQCWRMAHEKAAAEGREPFPIETH